ncbi:MAG TPA: hypothetical protein VLA58_09245, partial [Chitinophagaceae bacterium]|nr:hypothetical protein [Chitinophagaceae bacterium]
GWKPTLKVTRPPPPMNPKTRMKINGNNTLKTMADGLLSNDRKLDLVMASMARIWLYDCFIRRPQSYRKNSK